MRNTIKGNIISAVTLLTMFVILMVYIYTDRSGGAIELSGGFVDKLFSVIIFFGAFGLVYSVMRKQQSTSKGMSVRFEPYSGNSRGFDDIAGNTEAKESAADIVDFLKEPEKYCAYGARMPHGVIMYGAPGTGKTLLAKAIAAEAGVAFFAVTGADFVQMYVGVGAARIRELFKAAREQCKAVIFIDEIDALGKKRGTQSNGGSDERDQTLNALLTEMSGFKSGDGIVVIAATNRLDVLDEALLRPGRFDRQIEISLPDLASREKILQLHASNKPLSNAVDLKALARQTVYFSGAMLENLLNEAAIFAAKRAAVKIDSNDIEKAYYTIIAGSEKKDRSNINERDRRITAYHESGHAIITKIVAPENTVSKITIIPSTKGAGGFCVNIPPDKMYSTKAEIRAQVMICLAGRAAEELTFGAEHITTGAANDIEKATTLIRDAVYSYGMNEKFGLLNMSVLSAGGIEHHAALEECQAEISKLYVAVKSIIVKNMSLLHAVANSLLERESLDGDELDDIIKPLIAKTL